MMSSFNFIGPKWCGANPDLLNGVLRDEWGFRGMVLTDWDGSYGYQNTDDWAAAVATRKLRKPHSIRLSEVM